MFPWSKHWLIQSPDTSVFSSYQPELRTGSAPKFSPTCSDNCSCRSYIFNLVFGVAGIKSDRYSLSFCCAFFINKLNHKFALCCSHEHRDFRLDCLEPQSREEAADHRWVWRFIFKHNEDPNCTARAPIRWLKAHLILQLYLFSNEENAEISLAASRLAPNPFMMYLR